MIGTGCRDDPPAGTAMINRLMDRMRAVEGNLMRVRGKIRPLTH